MNKSFENELVYLPGGRFTLPENLRNGLIILECFADKENTSTFKVFDKNKKKICLLKTFQYKNKCLLNGLEHKSLPEFIREESGDKFSYSLTEYADGVSLKDYTDDNGILTANEAVDIITALCGALIYLHGQTPPVIHRDIKPSNIIINPVNNKITLIDFGIARLYSENAETDTTFCGTRDYAAPEQFGARQTDPRSDIYSAGVTLRYLVTGSEKGHVKDAGLARIINKCAAFDPEDRYESALALKLALINYKHNLIRRAVAAAIFAAVLFFAFSTGYLIGRYFSAEPLSPEVLTAETASPVYRFVEPLIEEAVRVQLEIRGRPITEEDLLNVKVLAVVGDKTFKIAEPFGKENIYDHFLRDGNVLYGNIQSLEDIAMMKNINRLVLFRQMITDLTPLKNLPLTHLGIDGNPVSDISVLRYCPVLVDLSANNTNISDVSVSSYLTKLQMVRLSNTKLSSFEQLTGGGISFLTADFVPADDYASLRSLASLTTFSASPSMTEELEEICGSKTIGCFYLNINGVIDLSPLKNFENLTEMFIRSGSGIPIDYSVLSEVKNLKKVTAYDPEIAEQIREDNPGAAFETEISDN